MTAAMDYPTITQAYYVRTGERGDIVLKVEFENLPPMTFYAESIKGLVLKEGILEKYLAMQSIPTSTNTEKMSKAVNWVFKAQRPSIRG